MKHLHRLIVTSAAYRMSSSTAGAEASAAKDPDNLSWWRREPIRCEAEVVRDSILAHAGELDLTSGGPRVLSEDLDPRGLLDETIVVFATEFGRTPGSQNTDGRDHHIFGVSVWLAGGGLKRGVVHGATDEIGFHAVDDCHYVTDIHLTILHQLGLDSLRLEVPGRKRLEIDHGNPIKEIIA